MSGVAGPGPLGLAGWGLLTITGCVHHLSFDTYADWRGFRLDLVSPHGHKTSTQTMAPKMRPGHVEPILMTRAHGSPT